MVGGATSPQLCARPEVSSKVAQEKICPFSNAGEGGAILCQREKCAWWDSDNKRCILVTLTERISDFVYFETEKEEQY